MRFKKKVERLGKVGKVKRWEGVEKVEGLDILKQK